MTTNADLTALAIEAEALTEKIITAAGVMGVAGYEPEAYICFRSGGVESRHALAREEIGPPLSSLGLQPPEKDRGNGPASRPTYTGLCGVKLKGSRSGDRPASIAERDK